MDANKQQGALGWSSGWLLTSSNVPSSEVSPDQDELLLPAYFLARSFFTGQFALIKPKTKQKKGKATHAPAGSRHSEGKWRASLFFFFLLFRLLCQLAAGFFVGSCHGYAKVSDHLWALFWCKKERDESTDKLADPVGRNPAFLKQRGIKKEKKNLDSAADRGD